MRYSLTGATGFVGGALARQLHEAGHAVRALVRDPARAGRLVELGIELVAGDLDDLDAIGRVCDGSDGLFHVAGWYRLGSRHPDEGWRVNVEGTRNALAAARDNDVSRVVYTSTLAVNSDTHGLVVDESYRFRGKHLSVYDQTKAAAHDIALDFAAAGLPVVIVMPGLVYGPGDTAQTGSIIRNVVSGRRVVVPAGGGVCWGYIDDVPPGTFWRCSEARQVSRTCWRAPRATLVDGLRRVAAFAGTKPPITLPSAIVVATARLVGPLGRVIPLPPDYSSESLRSGVATYYGNPDKAMRHLGWSCRDLDEGLRETVHKGA